MSDASRYRSSIELNVPNMMRLTAPPARYTTKEDEDAAGTGEKEDTTPREPPRLAPPTGAKAPAGKRVPGALLVLGNSKDVGRANGTGARRT